jgi:hypothetical protein
VKATVPAIKKVKATAKTATDPVTITWTVFDFDGVGSTTLKIDGAPVTTGVTESGSGTTITYTYTGAWGAGKHVFTIDAADASSTAVPAKQAKGSFTVKARKASAPWHRPLRLSPKPVQPCLFRCWAPMPIQGNRL